MKKLICFLLMPALIVLILSSCSKGTDNNQINYIPSGIKQVVRTDLTNGSPDVTTYYFSYKSGSLVKLTSVHSFERDSMLFIYDSYNKLIQIQWKTENLTIQYSYDKNGDIDSANTHVGIAWQYWHYNNMHQLTGITFPASQQDSLNIEWNAAGDVSSADYLNQRYTVLYDNKRNPFIGFPEQPVFLTSIVNIGAYFISPPTQNNVIEATIVSGQNESKMILKYEYNNNSLPTKLYQAYYDGSQKDSVIYEFNY